MINAIILAAGKGERLLPLTEKIPKPLLSIWGERIIERQIRFLREAEVGTITLVVGYLYESFLYLKDKYKNIEIIINDQYDNTNNFHSLFLARNRLENTWIIEGDIFMINNLFLRRYKSVYYSSTKPVIEYEWYFEYDDNEQIQSIHIADRRALPNLFTGNYYINMGISFWTKNSCEIIKNLFETIYKDVNLFNIYKNSYWDQLIFDYLNRFQLYIHIVDKKEWYEIDSVRDLDVISKDIRVKKQHSKW